jgi:GcrA cell cycle regulator
MTMQTIDSWTDDQVAALRKLWSEGLSASQIGVHLPSFSRSAILGKAHRLKLAPRRVVSVAPEPRAESRFNPPADRAAALKKRPAPLPRRNQTNSLAGKLAIIEAEPGLPEHLEEPAVGAGLQLIDLGNGNCRWPFGHPNSDRFYFCGAVGADLGNRRPYCPFHTRKAAGDPVNNKRFDGAALFAAGIKSTSKGARHG